MCENLMENFMKRAWSWKQVNEVRNVAAATKKQNSNFREKKVLVVQIYLNQV